MLCSLARNPILCIFILCFGCMYKDKKFSKGIYGTATKEDIKELREEGIEAEVIPWIKENTN